MVRCFSRPSWLCLSILGLMPMIGNAAVGDTVMPTPTGLHNDTGTTQCMDYPVGHKTNFIPRLYVQLYGSDALGYLGSGLGAWHLNKRGSFSCTITKDPYDGDIVPEGQDADFQKALSVTKIDLTGKEVASSSTNYNCLKDNVTGLIWEIKNNERGLHAKDDLFSWYQPDSSKHLGFAGYAKAMDYAWPSYVSQTNFTCTGFQDGDSSTYCNTDAFVKRVNAEKLCGGTNWRLPTREELLDLGTFDVTPEWSSLQLKGEFWTADPVFSSVGSAPSKLAKRIGFSMLSVDGAVNMAQPLRVRLVRDNH